MVNNLSLAMVAAGLTVASVASAPVPSRIGAPVMNANYQDDDWDAQPPGYLIALALIAAIVAISLPGQEDPSSP